MLPKSAGAMPAMSQGENQVRAGHQLHHKPVIPQAEVLRAQEVNFQKVCRWLPLSSDAPDVGGGEPKRAMMTYWTLGSREMMGVEFPVNVEKILAGAYFLFAAVKVRDCHGGPDRAIVLY